jgi:hypothetical protein
MKNRIMGILIFQNMNDALKAMDVVEDAGYELNIRHDIVDKYSAAVFVEAWCYVASDTDELVAISAIHDELDHLVDPFHGLADDVGAFAEGEPHDFYGTRDGGRHAHRHKVRTHVCYDFSFMSATNPKPIGCRATVVPSIRSWRCRLSPGLSNLVRALATSE